MQLSLMNDINFHVCKYILNMNMNQNVKYEKLIGKAKSTWRRSSLFIRFRGFITAYGLTMA